MPFKPKPYIKVGRNDWQATIPRPPKHATHARMMASDPFASDPSPKPVTLPIKDFGCFKGVRGDFQFVRMNNKRKVLEEYDGQWYWDGCKVKGLEV